MRMKKKMCEKKYLHTSEQKFILITLDNGFWLKCIFLFYFSFLGGERRSFCFYYQQQ